MNSPCRIPFVLLVLSMSATAAELDARYLQGLGDARYHHVQSARLERALHVYVSLPPDYDAAAETHYPAVYLLDGGELFPMLAAYQRYLRLADEVPPVIVVGISYGSDTFESGNHRSGDYTAPSDERNYWGGAGRFQAFLADELLPLIERRYPADPGRRLVFGHSLGGQFVLYTALTRPGLFWGHLASNPALHRNLPFFLQPPGDAGGGSPSGLFVGLGTGDEPAFREPALAWVAHWSGVEPKPWRLETQDLAGHSHMSTPPAVYRAGMRWLFADH